MLRDSHQLMVCILWKFCLNKANMRTAFVNNAMIQRMLIAAFYDADADADADAYADV